jgi:tetratricopeptide (TPR) repeat protein
MNGIRVFYVGVLVFGVLLVGLAQAAPEDFSLAQRFFKDEVYKSAADHYRLYLEGAPDADKAPLARIGLARSLYKNNELENAVQVYQDFLVSHANHELVAEASFELAGLMGKLKNHGKATELYAGYSRLMAGKNKSQSALSLYLAAFHSFENNDFETSRTFARQYLEKFAAMSNENEVLLIMGKISAKENDWAASVAYLEKALQSKPTAAVEKSIRWHLSRAYVQVKSNQKAQAEYLKVLSSANGQDSSALLDEYTKFLYSIKNYKGLVDFLSHSNSGTGTKSNMVLSTNLQIMYAEALLQTGNAQGCLQVLQGVSTTEKSLLAKYVFLQADAYLALGDRAEAIQILTRAGEKGSASAFEKAAQVYLNDKMYTQAVQAYYQALAMHKTDSKRIPVILKIAQIYEENIMRYSVARMVYEDFQKNYPSSSKAAIAAMGLARCLQQEGRLEESAGAYLRVMEDYPLHSLAPEARTQYEYITQFVIQDAQSAVSKMLLIQAKGDYAQKSLDIAKVLEQDLKEYDKAYVQYQQFIKAYEPAVAASKQITAQDTALLAQAWFRSGFTLEKLMQKALYEKDAKMQARAKNQAIETYSFLISQYANSQLADDAEYRLLELAPFQLEKYLQFIQKYPQSDRLPEAYLRIGNVYLEKAEGMGALMGENAVEYFQKILNEYPDSPQKTEALLGVSKAYYLTGKAEQAEPTLKVLMHLPHAHKDIVAQAWLIMGQIQFSRRNGAEAKKNFSEVLFRFRSTPSAPKALYLLARTFQAQKQSEAIQYYKQYVEQYPTGEDLYLAYLGASQMYEEQKNWAKAIAPMQSFLKTDITGLEVAHAWERIGSLQVKEDAPEKAVESYKQAIYHGAGVKNNLYLNTADLLLQLDRFDSAKVYFENALKNAATYKDSALAVGGRLASLTMLGHEKEFMNEYKRFRKKFDDEQEVHARIVFYEGRKLMESNDESRARKRFNYLSSRFEKTSWAGEGTYYLGDIAYKKGSLKEALKQFKEYVEKTENGRSIVDTYLKMASIYYQNQEYRQALQYYHKAIQIGKGSPILLYRAHYNAAIAHEKVFEWEQAATLYRQVYTKHNNFTDGGVLVSEGFCWYNAQQFDKAREAFWQSLQDTTNTRMAEGHYWLAKSLDKLGKVEDAVAEFLKVSYLYRNDPMWGLTGFFEVGQIYERSGDVERARRMYQRIVDQDGLHGTLGSRAAKYIEKMDGK